VIARIPYDKNVKKSVAIKMPVVNLNPYAKASKEFFKLASGLVGQPYVQEGFIQRIVGRFKLIRKPQPSIESSLMP
jgi:MinD-like ATPase involved in chromosome partitioning or flagellar assembly